MWLGMQSAYELGPPHKEQGKILIRPLANRGRMCRRYSDLLCNNERALEKI